MQHFGPTLAFSLVSILAATLKEPAVNDVTAPMGDDSNYKFLYNYTKYLHGLYRFNSFIIFSQYEWRRRPIFLPDRTFEQALAEDFKVPTIVCNWQCPIKFRGVIGLDNMVFVQFKGMRDLILRSVDQSLDGLHFITILFFYKPRNNKPPTEAEILKFFNWCWSRNMINVAVTFQVSDESAGETQKSMLVDKEKISVMNPVYTYTPFPNITVVNLTDEIAKGRGEFTTVHIRNVNGYVFKTLVFNQVPFAYLSASHSCRGGQKYCADSLDGITGHLYKEYVRRINGSIDIVNVDDADAVLSATATGRVHLVPHPLSDFVLGHYLSAGSYPIAETKVCLVVPIQRDIASRYYLLRAFPTKIWRCVFFSFLLLFALEIILNYNTSTSIIQSLAQALMVALNLLLYLRYLPSLVDRIRQSYKWFHIISYFMTSVLTGIYAASLLEMLMNPPYGAQIDTVAQFLATDLKIMAVVSDRTVFFESKRLPAELIPRLYLVNTKTLNQHRSSLNGTFAFLANSDRWRMINYQQQHLSKPRLHYAAEELCTSMTFLRFPVQQDSPFTLSLDVFFMITQESGLFFKWRDMTLNQAKQLNFVKVVESETNPLSPLSVQHFALVIHLTGLLLLVSFTCFCVEVVWFHLLRRYLQKLRTEFWNYFYQWMRLIYSIN